MPPSLRSLAMICLCSLVVPTVISEERGWGSDGRPLPLREDIRALAEQGMTWVWGQQQDDGSFFDGRMFRLGITAFATLALLENGVDPNDPRIQSAVRWLIQHQQNDGGIYDPAEGLANYGTSAALMVFARLPEPPQEVVEQARDYLLGVQNQNADSRLYGGFGYQADDDREDLSNTSMAIQGLSAAGVPSDHPAMQRALEFVQRSQNLSSVNDSPAAGNDGSGTYSPLPERAGGSHAEEGTTAAGDSDGESASMPGVGTMTYALITSYITLDVPADDPRVQAALRWVGANYRFDGNPGMAASNARDGLFYYYLMMATTFDLVGTTTLPTTDGEADWRIDLFTHVYQRAQGVGDGSGGVFWINDSRRWGEGIPHLTTTYMLRALARVHDSLPK